MPADTHLELLTEHNERAAPTRSPRRARVMLTMSQPPAISWLPHYRDVVGYLSEYCGAVGPKGPKGDGFKVSYERVVNATRVVMMLLPGSSARHHAGCWYWHWYWYWDWDWYW